MIVTYTNTDPNRLCAYLLTFIGKFLARRNRENLKGRKREWSEEEKRENFILYM